ncbi:dihydrofolate reductase [Halorussus salinisoli]|uniref:dihydrofolate reductase n=1 Tax=Halorussus salinisoli TaxID=2558242 RepID=UPI002A90DDBF|nr:dihydrofolate reductase [Halorussus salinisoli]
MTESTMTESTTAPPSDLDLVLVAAVAENGVIGADGGIPWRYPADLKHFRDLTMGSPVVVGRRTYEYICERTGGPLDGRTNVVLSSTLAEPSEKGVQVVRSLSEAIESANAAATDGVAYVIGGATVYEQAFPLASKMVLTEVPERPTGDARFPDWDDDEWREIDRGSAGDLTVVTYERR